MVHVLDLDFQGHPGTIASFLVETADGPALVESGPATTLPALEQGLGKHGHRLEDVGHVFLTHIHFDHAGAAWRLAEHGATIHVHPFGVRHLGEPETLWKSAKRVFGDDMERLWGEMRSIPEDRLHACEDGETIAMGDAEFKAWHTPGHAKHHIAWQLGDNVFTGDAAGVALEGGPVQPPCPPPDIDLEAWKQSLDQLRALKARAFYLTHFGKVEQVEALLDELSEALNRWCQWVDDRFIPEVKPAELIPLFEAHVADELRQRGVSETGVSDYLIANPPFMSVNGLARYLTQCREAN